MKMPEIFFAERNIKNTIENRKGKTDCVRLPSHPPTYPLALLTTFIWNLMRFFRCLYKTTTCRTDGTRQIVYYYFSRLGLLKSRHRINRTAKLQISDSQLCWWYDLVNKPIVINSICKTIGVEEYMYNLKFVVRYE